jgi:hypothetical protein
MFIFKKVFLWSTLFIIVCSSEIAVAQPDTTLPVMFSELNGVVPKLDPNRESDPLGSKFRRRFMLLNMGLFYDKNWQPKKLDRLKKFRLNLFPDIDLTVRMTHVEGGDMVSSSNTWFGDVSPICTECSGGDFSAGVDKNGLIGSLTGAAPHMFSIDCSPQDQNYVCEITEIDGSKKRRE